MNFVTRRSNLILLLLSVVFALVTTLAVIRQISRAEHSSAAVPTEMVLVVKKAVSAHTVIDTSEVELQSVDKPDVEPGALTSVDQAIGHFAATTWVPGQQVLAGMVVASDSPQAFALTVPKAQRAVTIADDALTGVDHLISPGDTVDVIAAYSQTADHGPAVRTILQDILVLQADRSPATTASSSSGGTPSSGTPQTDSITLAVTPEQAQKLYYAEVYGSVRLTLRNPHNNAPVSLTQVDSRHQGPAH